LNRSSDNHTGRNEQSGCRAFSRGRTQAKKEQKIKEDGRYIIFYTFESEGEQESREP